MSMKWNVREHILFLKYNRELENSYYFYKFQNLIEII